MSASSDERFVVQARLLGCDDTSNKSRRKSVSSLSTGWYIYPTIIPTFASVIIR